MLNKNDNIIECRAYLKNVAIVWLMNWSVGDGECYYQKTCLIFKFLINSIIYFYYRKYIGIIIYIIIGIWFINT